MKKQKTPANNKLPLGPTGRQLVVLRPGAVTTHVKALRDRIGIKAASSADFDEAAVNEAKLGDADGLIFEQLGVAVVDADKDQIKALNIAVADESNPILSIEPEEYVIPFCDGSHDQSQTNGPALLTASGEAYFRGYADALRALSENLLRGGAGAMTAAEVGIAATFSDTATLTWGLQATKADKSRCTGRGIRVAIIDTGLDLKHPDFFGRSIQSASFVPGVPSAQDGHGHGTHCTGTSCGPKVPPATGNARRYGIAGDATILIGKVLSDQGSGQDGWILAGINWAIQNQATIISMSLGSPVAVGGTFKAAYEQAALAALNKNCLIIAAAGNSGQDPNYYPVGSPANCPSIIAVAAVDNNLHRAPFSCIGVNPNGGEVNIAGPGVNVYSSYKMPTRYAMLSGTSMATPHVSGCAALWAQWTGLRGKALWLKLTGTAQNIGLPAQQGGSGVVQAPSCGKGIIPHIPHIPLPIPQPHLPPPPIPGPDPGPLLPGPREG